MGGAVAANVFPLHEKRWLAAPTAQVMSQRPSECLAAATNYSIEVGRAAFRTPLLLGGQAARAGITCESCHRGGRGNPDFFFSGLSIEPGTADVTASLFSSHRGDGIDNPKPIPDLGGPPIKLKVSRDPAKPDLRNFIHGLVTQEFDGREPPPAVLEGLASYVRAVSAKACPQNALSPIRLNGLMEDTARAARAAGQALVRKDSATALLMVGSARSQLGLVYERYAPQKGLERDAMMIRAADTELAAIAEDIRNGRGDMILRLARWNGQATILTRQLAKNESRSLFDVKQLEEAAKPD